MKRYSDLKLGDVVHEVGLREDYDDDVMHLVVSKPEHDHVWMLNLSTGKHSRWNVRGRMPWTYSVIRGADNVRPRKEGA